jgi:hypothetical protein
VVYELWKVVIQQRRFFMIHFLPRQLHMNESKTVIQVRAGHGWMDWCFIPDGVRQSFTKGGHPETSPIWLWRRPGHVHVIMNNLPIFIPRHYWPPVISEPGFETCPHHHRPPAIFELGLEICLPRSQTVLYRAPIIH